VYGTEVYSAGVGPKGPALERFLDIKKKKKKRFAFGKIFGAVIGLLRRSIPACSALLGSRKRL
jgi:hypothetical protein